jgi:hypothetical protein
MPHRSKDCARFKPLKYQGYKNQATGLLRLIATAAQYSGSRGVREPDDVERRGKFQPAERAGT